MSSVDYWAKVENFVQKIVSLIFHNDFFVFCWCCGKAVDKVVGLRGLVCGVWRSMYGARCEEVMLQRS